MSNIIFVSDRKHQIKNELFFVKSLKNDAQLIQKQYYLVNNYNLEFILATYYASKLLHKFQLI